MVGRSQVRDQACKTGGEGLALAAAGDNQHTALRALGHWLREVPGREAEQAYRNAAASDDPHALRELPRG